MCCSNIYKNFFISALALTFCYPLSPLLADPSSKFLCTKIDSVEKLYDEYDLSKWPLFTGGFINFGYWDKLDTQKSISDLTRLESEKNLYRVVLKKMDITKKDTLLEVACGQGLGSSLALEEFAPGHVTGIDLSSAQILRAKNKTKNDSIHFCIGKAENIPFESEHFNKVFSIEAAQHFSSLQDFSNEAFRVLKPQGKLAIATFFALSAESAQKAAPLIKSTDQNVDRLIPLENVTMTLQNSGFKHIKIESIGKKVWPQFDQWIAQTDFKDTWNRNWYKAYEQGLLDYYIVTAEKI